MISDYFKEVERKIEAMRIVAEKSIDYREFGPEEGMIRGKLLFIDGKVLEFMEYVSRERRPKYRFHLMDEKAEMIFRYDNAPHHDVPTFPYHKHTPEGVEGSEERKLLEMVLLDYIIVWY